MDSMGDRRLYRHVNSAWGLREKYFLLILIENKMDHILHHLNSPNPEGASPLLFSSLMCNLTLNAFSTYVL